MNHHHQEKDPVKRQEERVKKLQRRSNLLANLKNDVYCRLGTSSISGVGVFSIRDIPNNTIIFKKCPEPSAPPVETHCSMLSDVPESVQEYISDMFVLSPTLTYDFPATGLNALDISWYINHSNSPNVKFLSEETMVGDFLVFVTNRNVYEGEELTQDYNNLSNNKEELYSQFPFLHNKK